MKYQRPAQRGLLLCFSMLVFALTPSMAWSTDAWSSKSKDEPWQRIHRLQSVDQTVRGRSSFVTGCMESSYVVERAAAVSWVARTRSVAHVQDLEKRLSDESVEVRRLAWNALLKMPDVKAAQLVLREMETQLKLLPVYPNGNGMGGSSNITQVCKLPLRERRDWLAKLGDREAWCQAFAKERENDNLIRCALESSDIEARDGLTFSLPTQADAFHIYCGGRIRETSAQVSSMYRTLPAGRRFIANDKSLQIELIQPPTISPGVYAISLTPRPTGFHYDPQAYELSYFPFYVRMHRSSDQEQEIKQLLEQPLDADAIKRLGELRASAAVPNLIEHFVNSKDCDMLVSGSALAMIGDPQAAKVFIEHYNMSCDEPISCLAWLRELDAKARPICNQQILEIGSNLLDNWSELTEAERTRKLNSIELAYSNCQRPLSDQHTALSKKLVSRLVEDARQSMDKERLQKHARVANFIVSEIGYSPQALTQWMKENATDAELMIGFLFGCQHPRFFEEIEYDQMGPGLKAVYEEIPNWTRTAKLTNAQLLEVDRESKAIKKELLKHTGQ